MLINHTSFLLLCVQKQLRNRSRSQTDGALFFFLVRAFLLLFYCNDQMKEGSLAVWSLLGSLIPSLPYQSWQSRYSQDPTTHPSHIHHTHGAPWLGTLREASKAPHRTAGRKQSQHGVHPAAPPHTCGVWQARSRLSRGTWFCLGWPAFAKAARQSQPLPWD